MGKSKLTKFLGAVGGVLLLVFGLSFYEGYFTSWPIVKKLCTEPNGGEIEFKGWEYWGTKGDNCVVTFKQGESLVSYKVNLKTKTATLVGNNSLVHEKNYGAIF